MTMPADDAHVVQLTLHGSGSRLFSWLRDTLTKFCLHFLRGLQKHLQTTAVVCEIKVQTKRVAKFHILQLQTTAPTGLSSRN